MTQREKVHLVLNRQLPDRVLNGLGVCGTSSMHVLACDRGVLYLRRADPRLRRLSHRRAVCLRILTNKHEKLLASCYRSCLAIAEESGCKSIAFCCISTGVFGFPQQRAAEIAVQTVLNYRVETRSCIEVLFNVFKNEDYEIYRELLG